MPKSVVGIRPHTLDPGRVADAACGREDQMETFRFQPGETPVLISLPHVGTDIPLDIAERMTDAAHEVSDTDWHLDRLYNFAPALGVGFLAATQSRYVIDLNRDPMGHALYRQRQH